MSGLTNGYITNIGKKIIGKTFLGSFPCNLIPNIEKKSNFSIILNLSKLEEEGTHFIAIYADATKLLYFDPLGNNCKNKYINNFITKNKKNRKVVKTFPTIQSDKSIFCGYFCLGFLLAMNLGDIFEDFFSIFSYDDLNQNDFKIIDFIQTNI